MNTITTASADQLDAAERRVRGTYAAGAMPDIADERLLLDAGRMSRAELRRLECGPLPHFAPPVGEVEFVLEDDGTLLPIA